MVEVQVGKQGLDGHGSHFLTARRVIIDHDQRQRGKEKTTVPKQQVLSGKIKT